MTNTLRLVDHPLVQHKLTLLRRASTSTATFRQLLKELGLLLGYEVTHDLPLEEVEVNTPLEATRGRLVMGKKLCLVPILRAGDGLLEGLLELVPSARVGHIGLYRDPATLVPVEYYFKVPSDLAERRVIVLDPMLATGHSAVAAITRLKEEGATDLKLMCVVAAPEGARAMAESHPDVPVLAAALDDRLDQDGYIRPGLGDAGDRLFGTK